MIYLLLGVLLTHAHAVEHVLLYNGTRVDLWLASDDTGIALGCRHSRVELVQATLYALDANADGCVDLTEMRNSFASCLSWYERIGMRVGSVVGSIQTPESTMMRCDRNADDRMCIDDVLVTQRECQSYTLDELRSGTTKNSCLCTCSAMDKLYKFILDRQPC